MTISITTIVIVLLTFIILLLSFSLTLSIFAHNNSTISIPVAKKSILLDGLRNNTEWDDAFKLNFTSPRVHEGYVIVYLKYELSNNTLSGFFYIPDKTKFINQTSPDQISFNFDTLHTASKTINSNDHFIVFVRDGHAEYWRGEDTQNTSKGKFISIANSTTKTLKLSNPFSRLDFKTLSKNDSWQGEFKIFFSAKDVDRYGFAIQQKDSYEKSGEIKNFSINYPIANLTQANNPSTWGDITFFGIKQYAKNIRKFCSDNLAITPNNINILCIKSAEPSSVEEKISGDVTIQGVLGNLINGTGIQNQTIGTYIINSKGHGVSEEQKVQTMSDGSFLSTIRGIKLDGNDTYRIFAIPISGFSELKATKDLIVIRHVLTFDEFLKTLGTYIGVIAAGIGLLAFAPKLKRHFSEKKQKVILYNYMNEINDICYSISEGIDQGAKHLRDKRNQILKSFYNGEISEDHFRLLDIKISECEQKLKS